MAQLFGRPDRLVKAPHPDEVASLVKKTGLPKGMILYAFESEGPQREDVERCLDKMKLYANGGF
jgi:hypothetical protein